MSPARLPLKASARWRVECWRDGTMVWAEEFDNLVVTEGRNTLLDRTFKTIPTSVNWYVGLKGSGAVAAADTMASHAGWAELTPYSNVTRPGYTVSAPSGGSLDNNASPATFNINATATVAGAFLTSDNTKGGTTGLLFGAGDFAAARSVFSGDTLNVKITVSISSV